MRIALIKRVTPEHLQDYLDRRLSAKDLACLYETKPQYVRKALPPRPKRAEDRLKKPELVRARREYRGLLAGKVDKGELTIEEAAKQAFCTVRTMYRYLSKARNA